MSPQARARRRGFGTARLGAVAAIAAAVAGAHLVAAAFAGTTTAPTMRPVAAPVVTHDLANTGLGWVSDPIPHHVFVRVVTASHRRVRHQPARRHVALHHTTRHHAARHHRRVHHPRPAFVSGPTSWSSLNAAIARIPTYVPLGARWVVGHTGGSWWGTADWFNDTIYISPATPLDRLYDVTVHEWSHILSVRDYNGDVEAAKAAMNAKFGGSDNVGAERAADCMAILQGAQWTHYTTCQSRTWRSWAERLLAGHRL